jgi:hypothetical protein
MQIKYMLIVLLWMIVATGCASRQPLQDAIPIPGFSESADGSSTPKLLLEAHPRVGFAPLRVSIRAVLKNVPAQDPVFSCMWKSWDFGDGAVSSEKNHCTNDYIVNSEYFAEHVYDETGVYEIRFILGEDQVHSNPVQVRVVGR